MTLIRYGAAVLPRPFCHRRLIDVANSCWLFVIIRLICHHTLFLSFSCNAHFFFTSSVVFLPFSLPLSLFSSLSLSISISISFYLYDHILFFLFMKRNKVFVNVRIINNVVLSLTYTLSACVYFCACSRMCDECVLLLNFTVKKCCYNKSGKSGILPACKYLCPFDSFLLQMYDQTWEKFAFGSLSSSPCPYLLQAYDFFFQVFRAFFKYLASMADLARCKHEV